MRITDEMIAEDEKRWRARDVVMELDYCSTYMRDRKDITNLDIRFYAYIMRKARDLLKAQEPEETRLVRHFSRPNVYADLWLHCEKCGGRVDDRYKPKFCPECGRAVKWE